MSLEETEIRQLRVEIERLQDEIARWKSTAAAAADEIEAHWAAHCDNDGAGPVNLVRRLRTRPVLYEVPAPIVPFNYRATARKWEGLED